MDNNLTPFPSDDGEKLFSDYGILPKNLVELGALALTVDPNAAKDGLRKITSLQKVNFV